MPANFAAKAITNGHTGIGSGFPNSSTVKNLSREVKLSLLDYSNKCLNAFIKKEIGRC
jgi:hypothetical protein